MRRVLGDFTGKPPLTPPSTGGELHRTCYKNESKLELIPLLSKEGLGVVCRQIQNVLIITTLLFPTISQAAEIKSKKELAVTTLDGQNFDLKNFHDKVVIVNFWAYWCSNCLYEMAVLEELYQQYHAQGLEIIGVSIDEKRSIKKVLKRAATVSYPNALMSEATANNFPDIDSLPVNFIIDAQGEEVMLRGSREKDELEAVLKPLLQKVGK